MTELAKSEMKDGLLTDVQMDLNDYSDNDFSAAKDGVITVLIPQQCNMQELAYWF